MRCNIDAKGKATRLLSGVFFLLVGLGLLLVVVFSMPEISWLWMVGVLLVAIGVFQVFEGWAGWCVLRAMGIKTRL
ncbi:MAG: hypothetical protein CMJ20_11705 [Phycisphaeraceae bacterium]|nr:hypothetical protein [Phycisphaeraceae bacterium]